MISYNKLKKSCGINIAHKDFEYFLVRMYTRIRKDDDRKNSKGSTPTKLKIPIYQMWFLPQLHPATDIPLSYANAIVDQFIGRHVYNCHDKSKGSYGNIVFANVTSNPEECLKPNKNDENSCYNGDPIKYYSIMSILAINKKKKEDLLKNENVLSLKELDVSIGYTWEWEIDKEDEVYEEDEDGDRMLDWNKTLCYATNFTPIECSVVGRGKGACTGAQIQKQLSVSSNFDGMGKSLSKRFMSLVTKSRANLSINSNSNSIKNERMKEFFNRLNMMNTTERKFTFNSAIRKLENFGKENQDMILENIKKFSYPNFNKKKEIGFMENPKDVEMKDEDKTPTIPDQTQSKTKNLLSAETPETSGGPPNGNNSKLMSKLSDEKIKYLNRKGIYTENDFANFGRAYLDIQFKTDVDYIAEQKKNMPTFLKNFEDGYGVITGKSECALPELFKNSYEQIAKNPYHKTFHEIINSFVNHVKNQEDLKKKNLATQSKRKEDLQTSTPPKKTKVINPSPPSNHMQFTSRTNTKTLSVGDTSNSGVKKPKFNDEIKRMFSSQYSDSSRKNMELAISNMNEPGFCFSDYVK